MYKTTIKNLENLFPYNPKVDDREKYNETVLDFLYEELVSELHKK